jgi:predicted metal-binding protein
MNNKHKNIMDTFKKIHPDLVKISTDKIVVAEWVRYKCRYGCPSYGQKLSCPPFSPTPDETRRLLSEYSVAVIVHSRTTPGTGWTPGQQKQHLEDCRGNLQKSVIEMERAAFLAGYYKSFALGAAPCSLCKTCVVGKKSKSSGTDSTVVHECRHRDIMRPPMDAFGIDMFQTARNAGYSIGVLKEYTDTADLYGLVLVE